MLNVMLSPIRQIIEKKLTLPVCALITGGSHQIRPAGLAARTPS